MLVFHALEINFDDVADLDLGSLAGDGEFLEGDAAFGFETNVDQYHVVLDGDHMALDDRAFEAGGSTERFIEEGGKALLGSGLGVNCRSHRLS